MNAFPQMTGTFTFGAASYAATLQPSWIYVGGQMTSITVTGANAAGAGAGGQTTLYPTTLTGISLTHHGSVAANGLVTIAILIDNIATALTVQGNLNENNTWILTGLAVPFAPGQILTCRAVRTIGSGSNAIKPFVQVAYVL